MDQRNLILALVLSMAILIGFQFLYADREPPPQDAALTEEGLAPAPDGVPAPGNGVPQADAAAPGAVPGVAPDLIMTREEVLQANNRVAIETPRVHGSFALTGGRIDDLWLSDYRETLDADSPEVLLLSPLGAPGAYYAEFGWAAASQGATKVPDAQTLWTANRDTLTPDSPVTLTWDNGEGLEFFRTLAIDDNYMITVTQRVENNGTASVTLFPYALASRTGLPDTLGFFILHEGPIGVFNETLSEVKYDDLMDDGPETETSTGGWIGFSDKYWLVALIPDQAQEFKAGFRHSFAGDDKFQVDYLRNGVVIAAGGVGEVTNRLFAGAKEVETLEAYRTGLGIDRFDLAVDWGWLFFLTKPIFQAIEYLFGLIGNFGVAIIVFTAFVRVLFFPLANKSFRSMAKMRVLQPEMTRLREAYKDDRERMTKETMALYKREGVNPLSGCMPILLQIPVFFALYKVLFRQFVWLDTVRSARVPYHRRLAAADGPDHVFATKAEPGAAGPDPGEGVHVLAGHLYGHSGGLPRGVGDLLDRQQCDDHCPAVDHHAPGRRDRRRRDTTGKNLKTAMAHETTSDQELEAGRVLFAQVCTYVTSAVDLASLPKPDLPEIAFVGRSNVGKSSLLNALTNRKSLARTSETPGRTRQINFFDLGGRLGLVDLPGYGYARAPKEAVREWTKLVEAYLRGRSSLRRAVLLVDGRIGPKDSDLTAMDLLDQAAVPTQIVLTKIDKVKAKALTAVAQTLTPELAKRAAAADQLVPVSSVKGTGIPELRATLAALAAPK